MPGKRGGVIEWVICPLREFLDGLPSGDASCERRSRFGKPEGSSWSSSKGAPADINLGIGKAES